MNDRTGAAPPPVEAPLNWRRPDPERDARTRFRAARVIGEIFDRGSFVREVELHLAIGAACPFSAWHDKEIWLAEFHRIGEERGYFV